jgi:DNA polymerase III subunit epsilon
MVTEAEMFAGRSLRFRLLLFFAAIAVGGIAAIGTGLIIGYTRNGADEPSGYIVGGLVAAFALLGIVTWIWLLFDDNVAKPLERLAADLRARVHAGVDVPIDPHPARYLGDLGGAAATLAADLVEARGALDRAVKLETRRIAAENLRFAAILRDIPAGVILCTASHRVVLYNAQVVPLFDGVGDIGLDRKLFGLLREEPIRHAYDQLRRAPDRDRALDLICATADGSRVLHGQMRLVHEEGRSTAGYVLTLRDVTSDLSAHAGRERLLHDMIEHVRRPAANLKTALDVLETETLEPQERAELQTVVASEAEALVSWINAFGKRLDASRGGWWPMSDIAARDIADALRATLEADGIAVQTELEPITLHCDGYALVQLLAGAVRDLLSKPDQVVLKIGKDDAGSMIELGYPGPALSVETVERWLARPLSGGYADFTANDALDNHSTDFWPETDDEGRASFRLPIPRAQIRPDLIPTDPRAEFYDFELLNAGAAGLDDDRPLDSLSYVVFDTETTGLSPSRDDEIVQIAAFRIVNGRLLKGENFDTLVDPERSIPASSTRIHRITDAMVMGAPKIGDASARFHQFAQDAVLVAHNAPFDMAFLRRHEVRTGVCFTNPVLDTVLMSAIIYGLTAEHSLDAVAARMGVEIAKDARHTGLGDAEATAKIFIKMLPLLRQAGFTTLGQILRELAKYRRMLRSNA